MTVAHCIAEEFLYPVATLGVGNEQKIYVLYQKSLEHIELWLWDPQTKEATKALLSTFTPAGISPLPDNIGFSFIDNGRVKVKLHSKRSPKSLEWYEPIYDIGILSWLNSTCYYFHAKEHERYKIFHGTVHSDIDPLIVQADHDCMYPYKIGNFIFYIERAPYADGGGTYALMQAPYPTLSCDPTNPFNNTQNFERRVAQLLSNNFQKKEPLISDTEKKCLLNVGEQPIAFLHMESEHLGFCIGHPVHIDKQDKTIALTCYQISMTTTNDLRKWYMQVLFEFEIPLDLLLPESSSRLYESILPLLPRYTHTTIYFTDTVAHATKKSGTATELFCYDRTTKTITQLSHASHAQQIYFSPISIGNTLFYGGSVVHEDTHTMSPGMWLNDHGVLSIELPQIQIVNL
jgi:hypothetical protein